MDLKTVEIEFSDLISFIDEWDANLSRSRIFVRTGAVIEEGEKVRLIVTFPYLMEKVNLLAVPESFMSGGILFEIRFFPPDRRKELERLRIMAAEMERELKRRGGEGSADVRGPEGEEAIEKGGPVVEEDIPEEGMESILSGWSQKGCDEFCTGEPVFSGTLLEKPFKNIIIDIYKGRYSGVLRYKSFTETRYFFFSGGIPQNVLTFPETRDEHEFYILYRQGRMDEKRVDELFRELRGDVMDPLDIAIEKGIMGREETFSIKSERMKYILSKMLYQYAGNFEFFRGDRHISYFPDVDFDLPTLLFSGVREIFKAHTPEEKAKFKEKFNLMFMIRKPDSPIDAEDFDLERLEGGFLKRILSRTRRVREIFQISPIGFLPTYTLVFGLKELGIVDFSEMAGEASRLSLLEKRLMNKEEAMKGKNLFEILEIHWISQKSAVEEAYQRLKKKYSLEEFKEQIDSDLIEMRDRIMKKIEEAYSAISDDFARRNYRKTLMDKDYIVFSADLLAKQGEMFIFKGELDLARDRFEKAMDLVPDNPEYMRRLNRIKELMQGRYE